MARRGENIYKRKDGRYEGRYVRGKTLDGKTKFGYVYAHSYSQVRVLLLKKKLNCLDETKNQKPSVHVLYGQWTEYWLMHTVREDVKESTFTNYIHIFKHLQSDIGMLEIAALTEKTLQHFLDRLAEKGLAYSTRSNILRMLKSSLRAACDSGVITRNPCQRLKLYKDTRKEQRVLNGIEQRNVTQEAYRSGDLACLLGLYLGLRVGEVSGLKWSDIHWEESTLTIRRTIQRCAGYNAKKTAILIGTPKSDASCRTLPIPAFIMKLLREKSTHASGPDAFICATKKGMSEPRVLQRRLERLLRRANVTGAHFHTLRHTFATRLLEAGVDIKTISVLLGHSCSRITLDFYAHSTLEQRRLALDRLVKIEGLAV